MKFLAAVVLLSVVLASTSSPNTDAPTGFDNKSNGITKPTKRNSTTQKP